MVQIPSGIDEGEGSAEDRESQDLMDPRSIFQPVGLKFIFFNFYVLLGSIT